MPDTETGKEAEIEGTFREGVHEGPHGSRRYRLFVPAARERPAPLLVMLHGCTQDPEDVARGTRLNQRAGGEGWLVLYPEQPASAHPQRCWNWYRPEHQRADAGEPALLAGMVESVIEERGVDPERVHLAGISAGGAMALVLAAARPELFAAVAAHSGVPYGAARGQEEAMSALAGGGPPSDELVERLRAALEGREPPPILLLHGAADPAVHPTNSRRAALAWWRAGAGPSASTGGDAAAGAGPADGPSLPDPDLETRGTSGGGLTWRRRLWRRDDGSLQVELWEVEGMGHAWSGGDASGSYTDPRGPDASAIAVDFFRRVTGES